jgi:GMP synthase-like glutamine amidotransferase
VSRRTALVVASSSDADPGHVGERLEQAGYDLHVVLRDARDLPRQLADLDVADHVALALLLGSPWSVADPLDDDHVARECALVRSLGGAGIPVLGICYGAQLLAHALGGSVARAPRAEVGWIEVTSEDAALVPEGPWLAFHTDVIAAPPQAEVVARNSFGVQAFALPGVLGVQFHPEVRPEVLAGWVARFPGLLLECGLDGAALVAEVHARSDESRRGAYTLVDAFLTHVGLRVRA